MNKMNKIMDNITKKDKRKSMNFTEYSEDLNKKVNREFYKEWNLNLIKKYLSIFLLVAYHVFTHSMLSNSAGILTFTMFFIETEIKSIKKIYNINCLLIFPKELKCFFQDIKL